jgi:tape measure domain-containing protein
MAVEVGSAYVSVMPSFRGFDNAVRSSVASSSKDIESGLSAAGTRAGSAAGENAGSSFASHMAGALKATGVIVASVAGAAAAAGASMATIGIKSAAAMQQNQVAFTTLLGSSDEAKRRLNDLSNFATNTPFTLPGVVDAARSLLGVGQSADSVIPTLTAFGDTAGAMGLSQDQFNRIMLATTQSIGKGKLQAEELMQMTEAQLPVWPLLSKAMGLSIPVLQDMASKGQLLTADVLPKLQVQMEKDYGGAMVKQSQTLTGVWSNLSDAINKGLGQAMLPLAPMFGTLTVAATRLIQEGLGKLTAWISRTAVPWLMRFGQEWTKNIQGSFGGETHRIISGIADALKGLFTGNAGETTTSLKEIGSALHDASPALKDMVSQLPSFNDLLRTSAVVIKFLAGHLDLLAKALPFIVAGFIAYKAAVALANVAEVVSLPIKVLHVASNFALARSQRAMVAALAESTAAQSGQNVVMTEAVVVENDGIFARAGSVISLVAQKVALGASAVATGIATAATWLYNSAVNGTLLTQVRAAAVTVAYRIASVASTVATYAWTAAQWALNAAMDANPIGIIVLVLVALVAAVIYCWTHFRGFRDVVMSAWDGIKTAAQWAWANIIQPVLAAIGVALQWLGGVFTWLYTNIILPVWQGIQIAIAVAWAVIQVVWGGIQIALGILGAIFVWLYTNIILPVWQGIQIAIAVAWAVIQVIWGGIQIALGILGAIFSWLYTNIILPVWQGIQIAIAVAWAVIQVIWGGIQIALGILGAIFSWLYTNIILPVWQGIQIAISVAWAVIQVIWGGIQIALGILGAIFTWLYEHIILPVWQGIQTAIAFAWSVIQVIWSGIQTAINILAGIFTWLYDVVIKPVWQGIQTEIAFAWSVIQVIWSGIQTAINVLAGVFHWLHDVVIKPVWDAITSAIQTAWGWIKQAFDSVMSGVHAMGAAFDTVKDAIGKAWQFISDAAKAPIKFIVETVINDAIIDNYNKLAKTFGVTGASAHVERVVLPKGFATGGLIQGPGTGTSDSILASVNGGGNIRVSNGEYIVPERSVRRYGVGFFDRLAGRRGPQAAYPGDGSQGLKFADGGLIGPAGLAQLASAAGFPASEIATAVAVAMAESGGNPNSVYTNGPNTDAPGSHDLGLWQINDFFNTDALKLGNWADPLTNARMAFYAWHNRGWRDWTTFVTGRYLEFLNGARSAVGAGAPGGGGLGGLFDMIMNPAKLLAGPINAALDKVPGTGEFRDMAVGMGHKLVNGLVDWVGRLAPKISFGGGGKGPNIPVPADLAGAVAATQQFLVAQRGKPYRWDEAGPGGYDCSGLLSAAWRVFHGQTPYSHIFSTSSEAPYFPKRGWGVFTAGWGDPGEGGPGGGPNDVGHTAGNVGGLPFESRGGDGVVVGGGVTDINRFAHVGHFDNGGWLPPEGFGVNHTSRPEAVMTDSQWKVAERALSGSAQGGPVINVYPRADQSEAEVAALVNRELAWAMR